MFTYETIKVNDTCNEHYYVGDLELDLLNLGISKEHIERMKSTYVAPELTYYQGTSEVSTRIVPLSKVIGFKRACVNQSIFDCVRHIKDGELDYRRFQDCFSYLRGRSLPELYLSYKQGKWPEKVLINHYVEEDTYYVSGNGNHRAIFAKLLGAPYILAEVTEMHENETKHKINMLYSKFGIDNIYMMKTFSSLPPIIVSFENGSYYIEGYQDELLQSPFEVRYRIFEKAISRDFEIAKKLDGLPKIIRKLLILFANNRVKQIMRKTPYPYNIYDPLMTLFDMSRDIN